MKQVHKRLLWCVRGAGWLMLLHAAIVLAQPAARLAAERTGVDSLRNRILHWMQELDAPKYFERHRALEELNRLTEQPEAATLLSSEVQQALRRAEISFEVRQQLEALAARLPKPAEAMTIEASPDELSRLLELLKSDSYGRRVGAAKRLEALATQPQWSVELMRRFSELLAEESLSADSRQQIKPLRDVARGAWLTSDPATWKLPPVSDAQLNGWLDDLCRPAPSAYSNRVWPVHENAQRQLMDLLARDEELPRLVKALESRLADPRLDADASARLSELHDWTRPAMAAEIWAESGYVGVQFLLVDVPQQSAGAMRPSHFDRIDDKTAHCISGSNLLPGEYPVGVAITRPEPGWLCQLVNLPTPRRRMAFEYALRAGSERRMRELTERTMNAYIKDKQYLTERQMLLLEELDLAVVSRLAGDYFLAVADQRLEPGPYRLGGEAASHHARIAFQLSHYGTREIAPSLLKALQANRFLPPAMETSPYHWGWIAAIAIAQRDPWPDVDAWLGSLLERTDPLTLAVEPPFGAEPEKNAAPKDEKQRLAELPELGATAAATLLERHGLTPSFYGLKPVDDPQIDDTGCRSYRFEDPANRRAVLRWWNERRLEGKRQAIHASRDARGS